MLLTLYRVLADHDVGDIGIFNQSRTDLVYATAGQVHVLSNSGTDPVFDVNNAERIDGVAGSVADIQFMGLSGT